MKQTEGLLIEIGLRLRNEQALGPTELNDCGDGHDVSAAQVGDSAICMAAKATRFNEHREPKPRTRCIASVFVLSSDAWGTGTYVCMSNMSGRPRPECNTKRSHALYAKSLCAYLPIMAVVFQRLAAAEAFRVVSRSGEEAWPNNWALWGVLDRPASTQALRNNSLPLCNLSNSAPCR